MISLRPCMLPSNSVMLSPRSYTPFCALARHLARLGVVGDRRNSPARRCEIARMWGRAGVNVVEVSDLFGTGDDGPELEAWTALTLAGSETSQLGLGAMLDRALRPAPTLAAMVRTLRWALGSRLELGLAASPARGTCSRGRSRVRQSRGTHAAARRTGPGSQGPPALPDEPNSMFPLDSWA